MNAVGQLFVMQKFLGFNSTTVSVYGLSVLNDIVNGHDWQVTQVFPRIGFCYVRLKFLGTAVNAVTAQCALPLNMLNEKIYLFLWWWITAAACVTTFYLCLWIARFSTTGREARYIYKYIHIGASDFSRHEEREMSTFARQYLRQDGTFLIRMIRLNAGDQIAVAVVKALWQRYKMANVDTLRKGFPISNSPTAPPSNIVPHDIYPQFKGYTKGSSVENDVADESNAARAAYV